MNPPKLTLEVELNPLTGNVNVKLPARDKILCLGMLAVAQQAVFSMTAAAPNNLIRPPPLIPPPDAAESPAG